MSSSSETRQPGDVQLWDTAVGRPLRGLIGAEPDRAFRNRGSFSDRKAILFSPDGRLLAAVSEWGLSIWNLRTGQRTQRISCRIRDLAAVAFSADGRFLALASNPLKSTGKQWPALQVWDLETKQPLHESLGEKRFFNAFLAFSADGKQLILCGKGQDKEPDELCVSDASSGRCLQNRPVRGRIAGLSADGRHWAIQEEGKPLAIVDFVSDKQLLALEGSWRDVLFASRPGCGGGRAMGNKRGLGRRQGPEAVHHSRQGSPS